MSKHHPVAATAAADENDDRGNDWNTTRVIYLHTGVYIFFQKVLNSSLPVFSH